MGIDPGFSGPCFADFPNVDLIVRHVPTIFLSFSYHCPTIVLSFSYHFPQLQ